MTARERSDGPTDQSADQSDGLKTDQYRTDGPIADSKSTDATASAEKRNQINETKSSVAARKADPKNTEILKTIMKRDGSYDETLKRMQEAAQLTSQAIQHADKKKKD